MFRRLFDVFTVGRNVGATLFGQLELPLVWTIGFRVILRSGELHVFLLFGWPCEVINYNDGLAFSVISRPFETKIFSHDGRILSI
jgi:hypothetical protein